MSNIIGLAHLGQKYLTQESILLDLVHMGNMILLNILVLYILDRKGEGDKEI